MNVIKTNLPEVIIFEPKISGDTRGFFLEHYQAERYSAHGVGGPFV
jgi:dTDP-4-dehydrorhamnose 3,5-epimerase